MSSKTAISSSEPITNELDSSESKKRWLAGQGLNIRLVAGAFLVVSITLMTICAPLIAPYNPDAYDLAAILQAPGQLHLFGTDEIGRDVLSRVIWGGRPVVTVVFFATIFSLVIGVLLGFLSSINPLINSALSRLADIQLSIPSLVFALLAIAVAGSQISNLIIVLALAAWPLHFRVVRAHALAVKRLPYFEVSHLVGSSLYYRAIRNYLPGVLPLLAVTTSVTATVTALSATGLSYLGLGVNVPDWGRMIATSKGQLSDALWASGFPALALILFLLGIQLIADAVSDITKNKGGLSHGQQ
jgi:peptide/nickel transport system permease protein